MQATDMQAVCLRHRARKRRGLTSGHASPHVHNYFHPPPHSVPTHHNDPHVLTHLDSLSPRVPRHSGIPHKHALQVPHNLYCRHIQHHKLFPPSRLRRPSCARGSKGQRRRNAISPTAAAVFQDQSQCRPALPGTSINKTVSGCSADTRTHCPVRSNLPLSGTSSKRRSNKTRMG